jgi:glycosyltransferase involved in cell wall biosynthesis
LLHAPTDMTPYLAQKKTVANGQLDILFVGDGDEPRKGALLLARTFAIVRRTHPTATLSYSGRMSPATMSAIRAALPEHAAHAITFHGIGKSEELPSLYAQATVFVNPAVWEAQGMVLVEALAAGTPVVACNHGGVTDIVSDARIGRLFAPGPIGVASYNEDGLAAAILDVAALARKDETASICREHARRFAFERLGPAYEAIITGVPELSRVETDDDPITRPAIVA